MGAIGRRSGLNGIFHQMGRDFDDFRFFIHHTPIVAKNLPCPLAFNQKPDIPKHIQSRHVDLLQVIGTENM